MLFSLAMLGLIALAFAAIWRSRKGSLAPNLFPTVLFYALSGLLYLIWSSLPLWSGPTTDLRAVIGLHNSAYGLSATLILTGLTLSEFLLLYSQSLLREQTKSTLLTSLLDTVPDLVWMKDPQGAYVVFNRRLEESMGRKAEQILGKTDFELIGHERAVGAAELDASAIASGKLVKREVEVLFLNDQHTEIHEIIKAPVRSPDGQLLGVLGFGRDMTERLRSEQALKASEAWFQALIYQAPLAVSITQGSTIRHANRVFSAVLGLPCDESLTGRSIFEFLAESAHDAARQILKSFESGEAHAVRFETQGQRQDGSVFPVLIHAALVELPGEVAVLSFIQDLTTEKLAADREAQLQEHRVQAQKMESLGSLAGGIAHNINNTLAAILNLSSVSLTLVGEGSPAARHLNTIMRAVERGAKTVKSLLGFARQTPLELVAIDLENLIQGQIQLLQGIIPANIELRVVLLPGVPPIFGEPATLSTDRPDEPVRERP
ncbi:MAG: PAS domain S-box protein [Spirochaetales bacterium]